ncbi:MAG: sulfotransferase family protein [Phocaeicola sp.]|uniref:sulfotransferase family protein n=1 Tax=Phocaeicola sp. TaxID=2773926 RepID=UPI003F9EE836
MDDIIGIQMIGTQRSGSNLLRVMLDAIDEIVAPHPPHILQRFLPLLPKYGDLSDKNNFHNLVEDVCELVCINPVPWEGVILNTENVLKECEHPTLFDVFHIIYKTVAIQTHATHWLCKSMKNSYYAKAMEDAGIHPFYLYLYRDGRDVALSFQKAIVGEKHIYALANVWKKDQEAALAVRSIVPAKRFISLSYEELIVDPEGTVRSLCQKLGVLYTNKVMDYYKSSESKHTAIAGKMWQNVIKPVLKNNSKKFLKEMSPNDICIFESVAGNVLKELGYELYTDSDKLCSFSEDEITLFMEENDRLKRKFKMEKVDPGDIEKRRPQMELLERIRNYNDK